jgi:hypothetical protein
VLGERGGRKEIATGITGWISDPGRSRRREGARSWSSWGVTHLVDELETVLVRLALVGELNRVEREGGRRVEGDDAGSEDGRGLWEERGGKLVVRTRTEGLFSRHDAAEERLPRGSSAPLATQIFRNP